MTEPGSLLAPTTIEEMVQYATQTPWGCFVEIGVYKGGSAFHLAALAKRQGRLFFGYDTFTGIPVSDPAIDCHQVGDFGDTDYESVCAAIPSGKFIKGLFPDSMLETMPPVAFAHLDVDQYESYLNCIDAIRPLMVRGGIIWMDDPDVSHLPGASAACFDRFGNDVQIAQCGKWFVRL